MLKLKHLPKQKEKKDVYRRQTDLNVPHQVLIRFYQKRPGQAVGLNKKQDEGALDNYLEVAFTLNHNKNNDLEDVSS